jgi:hypothetical protein
MQALFLKNLNPQKPKMFNLEQELTIKGFVFEVSLGNGERDRVLGVLLERVTDSCSLFLWFSTTVANSFSKRFLLAWEKNALQT